MLLLLLLLSSWALSFEFACLSDIWYFTCDLLYDSQLTTARQFKICLNNFMPIEPHDTGRISIESKSRNTVKCIEFMEYLLSQQIAKGYFHIFDKHFRHISCWNLFVCIYTWVNSLEPIGNWRRKKEVNTEAKTVATLLANGKQFFPEMYLIVLQRDENKRKCLPNWNRCFAQQHNTHIYTHTCPQQTIHKSFLAYFWLVQLLQLQVCLLRALTAWSAARELFANAENCSNICCIWPRCCCSCCCYCRKVPRLACHTKAYVVMKQKSRENL